MMNLRKGQPADLPAIMEIIHQAQRSLAEQGIDQWQDGYPDEAAMLQDMEKEYCYVVVEGEEILGVAALIPDGEPDYAVIYDGAWQGTGDYGYMTVHRVAVKDDVKRKGVASFLLSEAARIAQEQGLSALRLDTHRDNLRMQSCLERNGLTRCGIIHLGRGNISPEAAKKQIAPDTGEIDEAYIRLAYEKVF